MPLEAFTNVFAGNPLNRASDRRTDPQWLAERQADPEALGMVLWNGNPLVETSPKGTPQLAYLPMKLLQALSPGAEGPLFMGLWKDTPVFATDLDGTADPTDGPLSGMGKFSDLRSIALTLSGAEAAMTATAKAMYEWHRRHRHCAVCGERSAMVDGGWKRLCEVCKAEHFPRTDPVVIMLATHGEKCLLGRQAAWPAGMFSALAGFLEPGESIEEACARELFEEAALVARKVTYHSTQPWPYPSSLMIGLIAEVENEDATPDQTELEEVRWFTRAETRALLAGELKGTWAPPAMAIAHQLIKAWALAET